LGHTLCSLEVESNQKVAQEASLRLASKSLTTSLPTDPHWDGRKRLLKALLTPADA
jgi:hypothetical protein